MNSMGYVGYIEQRTKDDRKLSLKQYHVLYNHFDLDEEVTNSFIKNHTYNEVSDKIKYALSHRFIKDDSAHEDAGDRY